MTGLSERLALIIDAKTGGAVAEITKASKSVESLQVTQDKAALSAAKMQAALDKEAVSAAKLAGETEKLAGLQSKVQQSKLAAANAADKLKVSQLGAADAADALGRAGSAAGNLLSAGISKLGPAIASVGPAIAAAGIAKFLGDGIRAYSALAAEVEKFSAVTGSSAQQASLLVGQVKALGVDPDAAAKALQRMGASIGDGTTKLGEFGISVAHNRDGTTDLISTFDNLRVAYQNSADGATKDAIAKQLSLRAGTALVPLLNATREQIKAINDETKRRGELLTGTDVERAKELKIASNEMRLSFQALELSASKGLVPALTASLGEITKIVDKANQLSSFFDRQKGNRTFNGNDPLAKIMNWDPFHVFRRGDSGGRSGAVDSLSKQQALEDFVSPATDLATAAADKLTASLRSEVDAEKAVGDAARSVADAKLAEIKAQDAYDKLLKQGAVDAKAVAAAEKEVATASKEVRRAVEAEQKAQETLNKARERASALDLEEAATKIALAQDEVAIRKAAVGTAQEKLDNLLGSGSASADEIAAARAEVKRANDEVAAAVENVGRAQENQQKVQQKGTDADPAVAAALLGVRDAHENVQSAVDRQRESEQKLRDAQAGDPEFADKLAEAHQRVADAHQAIADAQDRQLTATLTLTKAAKDLNDELGHLPPGVLDNVGGQILAMLSAGASFDSVANELSKLYPNGMGGFSAGNGAGNGLGPGSYSPYTQISGARASGGPVLANGTYLVGENGPELLHMGAAAGYVSVNGGGHTVNQVFSGYDPAEIGRAAAREAAWSLATLPPVRRR